ncbi:peptide ABC transporter substrate-binding protein [Salipiger sp. HF18]|uniref:Peptide/nickel transport system substrate-binding protein n=1 Tax=Salipiger thiooxidans TaxID=282683 RepID=A0A1G7FHZ6_9RHOB|nr:MULTISPECIES: peptide ABC transporter substrate-binding protein [Salipiger]MAU48411.1 ABC transporter substrate-binding protein [Salipiger sp.]NIY94703.1 peptide ABC transporter substrate-binding protein [Salipiger sp. HF18]SDE75550.1 peptide/nickel transport system substrate-binding protein [Salipiger thiooxidans]
MTNTPFKDLTHPSRRGFLGMTMLTAAGLGLSGLPGAARAQATGQVIVGISQEPTVFNPHLLHIEVDEGIHWAIFDPLFSVEPDGSFAPRLVTEVPSIENGGISEDGTEWKITLKEGVTWHDGTPLTAEDVKFTLELQKDPDFRAARRTGHELIEEITVVSDTELTWKMSSAFAPYMAILSWTFIVPKHAFDGVDPNEAPFNQSPIGTGPYKWDSRAPGDNIQLVAYPDYHGDGASIERIVVKYVPDLTVLYTQFKTGDIDVIALQGISPDHYAEASTLEGKTVQLVPVGTVETLSLNLGNPVLADKAVREALYLGVDKTTILEALYYGLPTPTETYMPQQSFYYNPDLPGHVYDPEAGKALLDEAGWVPGGDGIREKDGQRLSFICSTTAGNHVREQMQQFLQQSWKEMGIEMEISNLPPAVMWADHWMQSQFDMAVAGIIFLTGPDPDTTNYMSTDSINAQGGAGQNTFQVSIPELDELLKKGATTVSPEARKPIYAEIQSMIREELPFLPLFQRNEVRGHLEGLQGYEPNINVRITFWNMQDWSWA